MCDITYFDFVKRYYTLYRKHNLGKWSKFGKRSWTEIDTIFLDPKNKCTIALCEYENVKSEDQQLEKLGSLVAKLAEELEQQNLVMQAVTGENLKIRNEFKKRVAELNDKIAVTRLIGEQIAKIGEGVKKWQEEKGEIEAKIAGIENFQKLVLEQSDDVILEFIKDIRRQLRARQLRNYPAGNGS